MNNQPPETKPSLGIKLVLTVLCVVVGAIVAFYFFR